MAIKLQSKIKYLMRCTNIGRFKSYFCLCGKILTDLYSCKIPKNNENAHNNFFIDFVFIVCSVVYIL